MKKIYGICITAFIIVMVVNVNIAHKSEKKVSMSWRNGVALTNNEVIRISFSYDYSGNMTRRELIIPSPSPAPPTNENGETEDIGTESGITEFAISGTDETEDVGAGGSMTKSAVAGVGNTGIAEIQRFDDLFTEMEISVYPNPTHGMLRVDITGVAIPHDAQIEIFSSNGTLVEKWTGISPNHSMDISDKPAGMYLLRLVLDKNCVKTWKIVKN